MKPRADHGHSAKERKEEVMIADTRPWYRRWWFGFLKWDGEWQFGLGPIAIRWPFVRA